MTEKRVIQIAQPVTGEDEWHSVKESIMSGWLTQGPKVAEFEKQFAQLHGCNHAIAVTSCTTALHLALAAAGVGPGDEVIVPSFTWVATANAVLYCGATPVFADVTKDSYNIDASQIAELLTPNTKAIMAVHLFGLCADVEAIRSVIPAGVYIIEDAACAAGASLNGVSAGALGDIACFSFHPRKSITTGEGGMVTTNNDEFAEAMQRMRNHGASISEEQRHHGPKPFILPEFAELGFNYRMTDLQGAVGLTQLKKLSSFIAERSDWADWYKEQLADIEWLSLPTFSEQFSHGWQSFVTYVDPTKAPRCRNDMMETLQAEGVSTRPGTHAIHMLDFYAKKYSFAAEDYPVSLGCAENTMAIPLHNKMTAADYEYVVEKLKQLH